MKIFFSRHPCLTTYMYLATTVHCCYRLKMERGTHISGRFRAGKFVSQTHVFSTRTMKAVTPEFHAPEQLKQQTLSVLCDMYGDRALWREPRVAPWSVSLSDKCPLSRSCPPPPTWTGLFRRSVLSASQLIALYAQQLSRFFKCYCR